MNGKVLAVLVALAGVLGVVTWLSYKPSSTLPSNHAGQSSTGLTPNAPGQSSSLLPSEPVRTITLSRLSETNPQQITISHVQASEGSHANPSPISQWIMTGSHIDQSLVDPSAVRAFLSLLQANPGKVVPANMTQDRASDSPSLLLTLNGNLGFALDPIAVAGVRQARKVITENSQLKQQESITIAESVAALMTFDGFAAWRTAQPFAAQSARLATITMIGSKDARIRLERKSGKWRLIEPVPAHADQDAVQKLVLALSGTTITRYLDPSKDSPKTPEQRLTDAGLRTPALMMQAWDFDQKTTLKLTVGAPADPEGKEYFARVETTSHGQQFDNIVTISSATLQTLVPEPAGYLGRAIFATTQADVTSIALMRSNKAITLSRNGEVWTERTAGAQPITCDPAHARAANELLTFLTQAGADAVSFAHKSPPKLPENSEPLTISLLGPGDVVLDSTTLHADAKSTVAISNAVIRAFQRVPGGVDLWISRMSVP
jgi:hypothetical protein